MIAGALRRVLGIAGVNLRRLARDRQALFFTFLLPLLLILILGLVFGSGSKVRLAVYRADDSDLARDLVARLRADDDFEVHESGSDRALVDAVQRYRAVAGVVVPAGYGADLLAGHAPDVTFVAERNQYVPAVQTAVAATLRGQAADVAAARTAGAITGRDPSALLASLPAASALVGRVDVVTAHTGAAKPWDSYSQVASQELVLMVFLIAMAASSQLVVSRSLGVSRRMLATPTPTGVVLLGEAAGRFAIALLQSLFIIAVTALVFGVDWGDPIAAFALVVGFSLVATGAAMLVGASTRSESQATAVSLVVALVLGALGGAMQPLETMTPVMRRLADLTPHAWAIVGYDHVIRRGAGVADILPQLGVLAGFAVVLLTLATWRLRRAVVG